MYASNKNDHLQNFSAISQFGLSQKSCQINLETPFESLILEERYVERGVCETEILYLARELFPLYLNGFMHSPTEYEQDKVCELFEDLRSHLEAAQLVTIVRNDEKPLALMVTREVETQEGKMLHLEGLIISSDYQGRGLGRIVLEREIARSNAVLLGFHTQSKAMLKLGEKLALYDQNLTNSLAAALGSRCPNGAIDAARYGGHSLYGDSEKFLATLAIKKIDCTHGDALIFVGRIIGNE